MEHTDARVIVTVSGGMVADVTFVNCPLTVVVEVRDLDVFDLPSDEFEALDINEDGDRYVSSEWTPDDAIPACALAMGCLCAGHARGNPASAMCDTSETAP